MSWPVDRIDVMTFPCEPPRPALAAVRACDVAGAGVTAAMHHHHRMAAPGIRCGGDDIGINRPFRRAGIEAARTATGVLVRAPPRGFFHPLVSPNRLESGSSFAGLLRKFSVLE